MKLVDLTHVLDENTPIYPGDYKTALAAYKTIEKDSYNAYLLKSGLHTGTHVDIPMHLTEDTKFVAEYPLNSFIGRGVLFDVRGESIIQMKPSYKELTDENSVVLLFTGFDTIYGKEEYFTEHPVVSYDLAEYLLSVRIKMLGMDIPAPDYAPFAFHKELLKSGTLVLENLTNLQKLIGVESFEVMALPLKINAEASFVRAVCIIN